MSLLTYTIIQSFDFDDNKSRVMGKIEKCIYFTILLALEGQKSFM